MTDHGSSSSYSRVDRNQQWRFGLARATSAFLVGMTLSGLSLWVLPFSVPNQFLVLAHTLAGVALFLPVSYYLLSHWLVYRRHQMTHVKLLGYVGLFVLALCNVSGLVLTVQALAGPRISYAWDTVHIVTTFAILAFVAPHILALVVRDREAHLVGMATHGKAVALATAAALVGVAFLVYAYPPPRLSEELPPDYSYAFGPDRPFAPSLAVTATGKAYDSRLLAGSEGCGTVGCHEQIFAEWQVSAHRYAAMDTAFQAIQLNMAEQNGPDSTRYCGGCHDPISLFSGAKNIFTDPEKLTAFAGFQEGVSCLSCHAIREVDVKGNANFLMGQPARYLFEIEHDQNPTEALRVARDFLIRAYPREHVRSLGKTLFKAPEYCASCHKQFVDQEINRVGWVQLQNQYDNWRKSRWNHAGNPEKTIECRECHMPLSASSDPASGDTADYNRASFVESANDAELSTRTLLPSAADLHYRGLSEVTREEGGLERYDYERFLPQAPWNAVSGLYTSYGDVGPLISSRDGRLVVMAPGDEMTLTFDPGELPLPASGRERDYFLHFTGWAKDQDPNTRSSRTIDPLPGRAKDGVDPQRTRRAPALVPRLSILAAAEEERKQSLTDSLTKGTPSLGLRYRYELVDDGGFDKEAHASTLRTVLGYRTLPYRGFSFFLQAQNVAAIGNDLFDNRGAGHLANGVSDRPAVVDPSQTRMQQIYGRLDAFDTTFDVGRREIAYGDHRFVGDVNWRQNHQAFDAIHLSNRSLSKTTLSYTFADKAIRIDGGTKDMSSHFVNALVALDPNLSLELFSYLLDYDAAADAGLSSQSYGGKLSGSRPLLEKHRLLFEAQYAKQTDFGANPADRNADYLHLVGGVGLSGKLTLKLGRELLGGSPENGAFQTPLATLFKFNGWADKFLTTPPNGLVDWYVSGEGRIRSASWTVAYHDFSADAGGEDYGSELDARAIFSTSWKQSFGAQLALYREDGLGTDTTKLWIWTEYSF